jgi:ribose/xylose/arabinose/galactoside ABC-type transport system permease subunit
VISILQQVSVNGVLALGMVFVICAGGIDLSIGSMLALTSVVIGETLKRSDSMWAAILLSILVCAFFGLVNGVLISRFNLFPFVVTLATQLVIRGVGYIISDGRTVTLTNKSFRRIGLGKFAGVVPNSIIILIGVAVVAYILLHWTKFGRYIYAVGGNINAATASGVKVFWTRTMSFVWMGVCAAIAGVILTSRINASQPNIGLGYETDAIAACVIGGTSFAGGVATIPGTLIGVAIMGVIYNGMNLLRISSYYQTVTKGLLVLGAVLLDIYINKKRS